MRLGSATTQARHRFRIRPRASTIYLRKDKLPRPTIYHLMGKLSTTKDYVISDEDLLEQLCELQSEARHP